MTVSQQFNDHLLALWNDAALKTPAFVYDEKAIREKLAILASFRQASGCRILYSLKALSFSGLLAEIAAFVDGFSVSSAFESRLADEVLGGRGSIHLTSPGIRPADLELIAKHCRYVSFNSLSQWHHYHLALAHLRCGLRVNPALSFAGDERYDPCRPASKLGVPMSLLGDGKALPAGLSGLHIHSNCESRDLGELVASMDQLINSNPELFHRVEWLNLGGGYLFDQLSDLAPLDDRLRQLQQDYDLEVFFEPGKAIVGTAGYLVASVIDLFESGDRTIAVVDTTINHLPEVFEYQYRPLVLQESSQGKYRYRIAGASCLSGDLFGDYYFDHELTIGSKVIIANVGAYMMVKANMFNGINLPAIYALDESGRIRLEKEFDYSHYRGRL